ncbi:hypothetical protein BDV93DRAFT_526441 [Ceratobasidium sp. AG-I]|nr:hypothetical protein BDV93DRAFT_526441 [Ceratobasidium sp. AG-I]
MADFSKVAAATVDLLLNAGRLYNVTVPKIAKRFDVKDGRVNTFAGTLYYNDADDLSGNQLSTTSTEDNKLVVEFKKGNRLVAKFKTSDNFPESVAPIDNPGNWVDV